MRIVCLDTQVLYWGIIGKATHGQEAVIPRARDFLVALAADHETHVIIPAIVLAELLAFVPEADQPDVLLRLQQDWLIVDFDARAALVFGQMRGNRFVQDQFESMRADPAETSRRALIADCLIIASAIAHDAEVIYSDDRALLRLADGWIDARRFEDEPYQMRLIGDDE
ncbi:MAG: PIN domain-containing protein [Chloroflexota bacterium]|nr:PIN domain-containing protein [Chloroflexota bacterium]